MNFTKGKIGCITLASSLLLMACGNTNQEADNSNSKASSDSVTSSEMMSSTSDKDSSKINSNNKGIEAKTFDYDMEDAVDEFNNTFSKAKITSIKMDNDNDNYVYEVSGYNDSNALNLEMDADSGEVVKTDDAKDRDEKSEDDVLDLEGSISPEEAMKNALKEAGSGYAKEWEINSVNDKPYYEIEIEDTDKANRDVRIDAKTGEQRKMKLSKKKFGEVEDHSVYEYTLENSQGLSLSALNYGGTITSIQTPDKENQFTNIVLGFDELDNYEEFRPFYGALVGPVAGRIDKGEFTLEGEEYQLQKNEGENHLHGGDPAFDSYLWNVTMEEENDEASIIFTTSISDGTNGYPGNREFKVRYTLTNTDEWIIQYEAETDKPTLINPTNHVFFNLSGDPAQTIKQQKLQIQSDYVAELREDNIPTGKLLPVKETDFDLNTPQLLEKGIESDLPQLKDRDGFDHPFLLTHETSDPDAVLSDETSGREVQVTTDRDAIVIYTHNGADDDYELNGEKVQPYAGVAMEAQNMPDAINQKDFGDITLDPGEVYEAQTTYKFVTEK